ncbi:hypothetical protein [Nocardia sp. NPDC050435]|uniref:hypothetical protein n=1 Tax=Nocardia sp. NPDC050435 TaxID=3155040 RepID=UPI0033C86C0A
MSKPTAEQIRALIGKYADSVALERYLEDPAACLAEWEELTRQPIVPTWGPACGTALELGIEFPALLAALAYELYTRDTADYALSRILPEGAGADWRR